MTVIQEQALALKIGIALDDVFLDTKTARAHWTELAKGDSKILNDPSFWTQIPVIDDGGAMDFMTLWRTDEYIPIEFHLFVDRPKDTKIITERWLKKSGLGSYFTQVHYNAIKRFDARMAGMNYFIDSDPTQIAWYRWDRITAVLIEPNNNCYNAEGDYYIAQDLEAALRVCLADYCGG